MNFLDTVIESFASPFGIDRNPDVSKRVTAAFAKVVAKRMSTTVASLDLPQSVKMAVENSVCAISSDMSWWMPEMSSPLGNIVKGQPIASIVSYLIGMHIGGLEGSWKLYLREPLRQSLAGNVFTLQGNVAVTAAEGLIVFVVDVAKQLTFAYRGGFWRCEQSEPHKDFSFKGPVELDDARFGSLYVLSTNLPEGGENDGIDWPPPADLQDLGSQALALPLLRRSLDSLSDSCTGLEWWVGDLLKGIATMPLLISGHRHSGSSIHFAGVVSSGFPADEEAVAESLVHEVSHQYFLLLESVVPMVDPAQENIQIWSTFKRRNRPLNRVLLAYHAAANMALYWAGIAKARGITAYRLNELQDALSHVEKMGSDIRSTNALSIHGHAFFDRLEGLVQEHCVSAILN